MARRREDPPSGGNAPWMNTFAALMNLLLCFFVIDTFSCRSSSSKKIFSYLYIYSDQRRTFRVQRYLQACCSSLCMEDCSLFIPTTSQRSIISIILVSFSQRNGFCGIFSSEKHRKEKCFSCILYNL